MTSKINFKQPKYIFPAVIFVPLCALVYFVMQTFGMGASDKPAVATDRINASLPEARTEEGGDKLYEMSRRFGDRDAFTAVAGLGEERGDSAGEPGHGYSEAELDRLDAAEAERLRQQREMEDLERSLAESRRHINRATAGGGSYADSYDSPSARGGSSGGNYSSKEDFARDLEAIQRRSYERQKAIEEGLGLGKEDREEAAERQRAEARGRQLAEEKERNRPNLVRKAQASNAGRFHTVESAAEQAEATLIRAMIDRTTKAQEGTRLRFKLLDDVTVKGVRLRKGTYLYGTVSGFGQQRVRAAITSILTGGKFIRVSLSVFDNDGMEGFYVPASSFRDFVKNATASAVQQNTGFDTADGYGTALSGEAIALQALQNMYNSASSAVSANLRKNKARIKYNTVVYLINSDEAR